MSTLSGHTTSEAMSMPEKIEGLCWSLLDELDANGTAEVEKGDDSTVLLAAAEMAKVFPEMLALLKQIEDWLRPEVVKEPDRTYFWKVLHMVRKAEGRDPLTNRSDEKEVTK